MRGGSAQRSRWPAAPERLVLVSDTSEYFLAYVTFIYQRWARKQPAKKGTTIYNWKENKMCAGNNHPLIYSFLLHPTFTSGLEKSHLQWRESEYMYVYTRTCMYIWFILSQVKIKIKQKLNCFHMWWGLYLSPRCVHLGIHSSLSRSKEPETQHS